MPGRFTAPAARVAWLLAAFVVLALVAHDFARGTTFLGDDYLFLAYARLAPTPLLAFVSDAHGGEYYRPIPMALWWLLDRAAGGSAWPFAVCGFVLHVGCGVLTAALARSLGLRRGTALLAGALFVAAPAAREAALWFSASTDLLAAAAMLAAVNAFLGRSAWARWGSVVLAAVAFWCKETALVLPLLLLAAAVFGGSACEARQRWRSSVVRVLPHAAVAAAYLVVRFVVLGGWGGTNNPSAPWWGWAVQLASGMVHAVSAYAPLPEWAAWAIGVPVVAAAVLLGRRADVAPLACTWMLVTLALLPAAGWVVGARYFYLPSVGLMLLVAVAVERLPRWAPAVVLAGLLALGLPSSAQRWGDIRLYRAAVGVARTAVADRVRAGHRVLLVRGAVKDLDLAVKLAAPDPGRQVPDYVVLADVPASFVWLPPSLSDRLRFLLADPPLPPSGAYRFGDQAIVGQARRDEAPDLDQVFAQLPELRIIHLRRAGEGYTWDDRTDDYRRELSP